MGYIGSKALERRDDRILGSYRPLGLFEFEKLRRSDPAIFFYENGRVLSAYGVTRVLHK